MATIGIDLGTTNSAAGHFDGHEARIVGGTDATMLIPSVVVRRPRRGAKAKGASGSPPEQEFLVGQAALDFAQLDPTNVIFSIKRLMGRTYDEEKVAEVRQRVNYRIARAEGEDPGLRVVLGDQPYTPTEISAHILGEIKKNAERVLGETVTHAVITVPAYFDDRQRAATRQAGEMAGLVVKRLIDEPSAAAIAYGITIERGVRRRLLVFDLGGGTFDVTILLTAADPKGRTHFEVLTIRGDNWLGGDDFDREIVREIIAWMEDEHGLDPSADPKFKFLAKQAAEKAKIHLTTAQEMEIVIPAASKRPDGADLDVDMVLTRERFEELIQPYVDRCMNEVQAALGEQGLTPRDIDTVLLVGGSTLVPKVHDTVADLFGREKVKQVINPFHSVALGAGILAGKLTGLQCPNETCRHVNDESRAECERCSEPLAAAQSVGEGMSLGETTAKAFGISAVSGGERDAYVVIIPKNTPYPLPKHKSRTFYTTAENHICVPIYQGNDLSAASKNEEQGVVEITEEEIRKAGVESVPVNTPVHVSFNYTRDGVIDVILEATVEGKTVKKQSQLRRDRPRQAPAAQADMTWKKDLEHLIDTAEHFKSTYLTYMEEREQLKLQRQIDRANLAMGGDNAIDGRHQASALAVMLDSCGIASTLFLADRVREGAGNERAAKIAEAINRLQQSWVRQDKESVAKLTTPLRAAIAAELRSRQDQQVVPGQQDFGGRLRTQGGTQGK